MSQCPKKREEENKNCKTGLDWTEHAHWTTFNPTVVEYL